MTDDIAVHEDMLAREAREQRRVSNKPDIDHLEDAWVREGGNVKFLLKCGDKVIIERKSVYLPNHTWLDTKMYTITEVDHETGDLKLYNDDLDQYAMSNFKTGVDQHGYKFKIPTRGMPRRGRMPTVNREESAAKAARTPKVPGTRRLYPSKKIKGHLDICFKGSLYVSPDNSQAKPSDRVTVELEGENVRVTHPDAGWQEIWNVH